MQGICEISEINIDYNTNKPKISFVFESKDILSNVDELKGLKLNLEAKKYRKGRSLNANNYAWQLITKLADVTRNSKEEMYEIMLQRYGTNLTDEEGQIIVVSSEKDLKSVANLHIAFIGTGQVKNKTFNHYRVIKGSSQYDTKEMSIFIDGIVGECQEQNIETMTPAELQNLKDSWK